jgi:hypothetical protein
MVWSNAAPPSHAVASMASRSVRQRERDFSDCSAQYSMFSFPVKCASCLYLLRVLSSRWLRKEPAAGWQAEDDALAMAAEGKVRSHR